MRGRVAHLLFSGVVAIGLSRGVAFAQSDYEVLHHLIEPAYPPSGKLLEVSSGRLHCVARRAGAFGRGALLAYDPRPDGTLTSTVIHSFSGPDGSSPIAGVIQGSDGALYGTTFEGGEANLGTVYRVAADGTFSVLHAFEHIPGSPGLGINPRAPLVEGSDGHLYGARFRDLQL